MPKLLITIICFLISLVLGIGLIWPEYQDFKNIQKSIDQKKLEIQYKEKYFSELQKISEELKNYNESLSKIDSALPVSPGFPNLFEFLQKSSSQNGLILKNITIGSSTPLEKFSDIKETNLVLSVSGSYSAFKNFLETLRKTARLIEIESIEFSSPAEKEIFSFNLNIKVYSY